MKLWTDMTKVGWFFLDTTVISDTIEYYRSQDLISIKVITEIAGVIGHDDLAFARRHGDYRFLQNSCRN